MKPFGNITGKSFRDTGIGVLKRPAVTWRQNKQTGLHGFQKLLHNTRNQGNRWFAERKKIFSSYLSD